MAAPDQQQNPYYYDAPEVAPAHAHHAGLEVAPQGAAWPEAAHPEHPQAAADHKMLATAEWNESGADGKHLYSPQTMPTPAAAEMGDVEQTGASAEAAAQDQGRPLWRRRRCWAALAVVLLIVVGVVVGCVVGIVLPNSRANTAVAGAAADGGSSAATPSSSATPTTSASSPPPTGTSTCKNTPCIEALAAVVDQTDETADKPVVHLFARAADGTLKQISATRGAAAGAYNGTWVSRGSAIAAGPISAAIWTAPTQILNGGRVLTVLALSTASEVLAKHISLTSDSATPLSRAVAGTVKGAPSVCTTLSNARLDYMVAAEDYSNIHHVTNQAYFQGRFTYLQGATDTGFVNFTLSSRPAFVCRGGDTNTLSHDIVVYDADSRARHRYWADPWSPWRVVDDGQKYMTGTYPAIVETGSDRIDFFGLGQDAAVRHWSWSMTGDKYSATESLGGSFASVPVAVISGSGEYVHVLAVDKDSGNLKHRAVSVSGSSVSSAWDDLGIQSNTAPALARIGLDTVEVFTTAVDGSIWAASVKSKSDGSWVQPTWMSIPGL